MREFDQQIAPIHGSRGACALCKKYEDLTQSHIFPRAVGNNVLFKAYGYGTTSTGQSEKLAARRFPSGVSFRTLCRDCNSKLGGSEDKEIVSFFAKVSADLRAKSLILPSPLQYTVKPNKIIRAVLAYLAIANDRSAPSAFDNEVRSVFLGKKHLRDLTFRVFYWPYNGKWLTIIKDVFVSHYFFKDPIWMQVAKFKPIGFAITDSKTLFKLPCINDYVTDHDEQERTIPLFLDQRESDIHWPANPGKTGAVLTSQDTGCVIAAPSWRT
jgi:hypothetical protein